jgi:hypothetical protein
VASLACRGCGETLAAPRCIALSFLRKTLYLMPTFAQISPLRIHCFYQSILLLSSPLLEHKVPPIHPRGWTLDEFLITNFTILNIIKIPILEKDKQAGINNRVVYTLFLLIKLKNKAIF